VDEFLKTHPEFEPDRDRERMLLTMHPKGYLRRMR
jgi:cephalosporin hydroxylase